MAVTIDNLLSIPDLPDAAALSDSDLFHVNQANTDAKASLLALTVWMMDKAHPTGSLFLTGVKGLNPNTLFPGQTWVRAAGAGRQIRICADDESNFGTLAGSDTVSITAANLPSHTHSFSATTGGSGGHTPAGSISQGGAHTHSFSATTSGSGGHTPSGSANSNGAHTHGFSATTGSAGAHTHLISILMDGQNTPIYGRTAATMNAIYLGSAGWTKVTSAGYYTPQTQSTGAHTHGVSGTTGSGGAHTHSLTMNAVANHTHTVSGTTGGISATHNHTFTGTAVAAHTHTVSGTTGAAYSATVTALAVAGASVFYGCWRRSA